MEKFLAILSICLEIYLAQRSIPSLSSSLRTRLRFGRIAGASLLWSSLIDCRSGLDAFRLALIYSINKQYIFLVRRLGLLIKENKTKKNFIRNFVYLCLFLLFLFFKLLWIIVIWFFSSYSGCSASFIDFFDSFTNSFRASSTEECIATFTWFCCDRNSAITFWAIFWNCPTFYHCFKLNSTFTTSKEIKCNANQLTLLL